MAQNLSFPFGGSTQQQQNAIATQASQQSNSAFSTPPRTQQMAFSLAQGTGNEDLARQLAGISPEQLAAIAQLFQSGRLPLPPPAAAIPAAVQPPEPVPVSTPTRSPARALHPAAKASEDVDMDREEGEVEDGEVNDTQGHARALVPTPPKGSKPAGRDLARRVSPQGQQQKPSGHARPASNRDSAVATFILEMHKAGFTFDQIAKEVSNPTALRSLYRKIGLPVNAVNGPAVALPQTSTNALSVVNGQTAAIAKRPAPAKAPPPAQQDRSAYLAKLQAAKNKKADVSPTPPKPVVATTAPENMQVKTVAIASPQQVKPSSTPAKAVLNNALIRQRLEALRAQHSAKPKPTTLSSDAGVSSSPSVNQSAQNGEQNPVHPGLGDGLADVAARASDNGVPSTSSPALIAARAAAPETYSPVVADALSPTLNRGTGLPGLFTRSPLDAQRHSFLPQPAQQSSDGILGSTRTQSSTTPSDSVHQKLRRFDTASATDEPFIITDSDEDDMDVEEAEETAGQKKAITDLKIDLANVARSIQETPSTSSTPGTPLARKMEELDRVKRRLAELQKRREESRAKLAQSLKTSSTEALPAIETMANGGQSSASRPAVNGDTASRIIAAPPSSTNTPHFVASANNADAEEDGFDDSDLYEPDAGVELPDAVDGAKFGSQATTIMASAHSQPNHVIEQPIRATVHGAQASADDAVQATEEFKDGFKSTGVGMPAGSRQSADNDAEDEIDDDDLDDIYGPPSTARQTEGVAQPYMPAPSDDNDAEADESDSDSDDAMDTSGDSSSGSAANEDEDFDADQDPPISSRNGQDDFESSSEDSETDTPAADSRGPHVNESDDLAPELQPSEEELGVPSEEVPQSQNIFTEYHSPLAIFKDFRYHPDFLHETTGGFKSMTYSHNIDPNKSLCPFETTGGICNDKDCPHQHFRTMALSDNELLKFMGTEKLPVHTVEEDKRWKAGLTNVVKQLRKKGQQQDVSAIAQAIAEFRREFIGDVSKTLTNLD